MTKTTCYAEGHYASGQPSPDELSRLQREGVRTVINLRGPDEPVEFDESAEARRLGLRYVALPVRGADDLEADRVRRFGQALDEARSEGGVLIHCATSNRVGAMVALDQALNRGQPLDAALELGRAAGLAALEPAVVDVVRREETSE
ncbi:beta-lactamase hydrolase domain-containing protein [Novilysobacter defluvii]|uniref:Beta-lactamase hydrolase-like protein phosphatase-like domain-containing protein n=1 Tax=Lysobacter defluvii IMMIB APB-9 = DSM 18482 TaxID=1385515 RepID=A0A0A0MA94_9GAMM|nr:protein tyrosine phosphatase family protein [Lysobacter defluvii]KGO99234.1 hypothetical protein N791_05710 [Lysobacter defluvii IMMIB APB-9 = DSM 18482]